MYMTFQDYNFNNIIAFSRNHSIHRLKFTFTKLIESESCQATFSLFLNETILNF